MVTLYCAIAIKAEKPNKILCDADELQLYLAKKVKGAVVEEEKGDDQKEWLTQLDALEGVSDTSGYKHLQFTDAELRDVGLDSGDLGENTLQMLLQQCLLQGPLH
ncbi:hypothetical protein PC123_g28550 [Phytophthora cactorum]|nr:hypothetical protein PC123_g28550 [Phytophthora cactorum]